MDIVEASPQAADSKITLLVVEDQAITRLGLKMVLSRCTGFEIVGEADNGQSAIEQAQALKPAVVIMDISMPILNGIEATQKLKELMPEIKVVILTSREEDDAILRHWQRAQTATA
jgi:two-component system, NarL family, response regulator LiaR